MTTARIASLSILNATKLGATACVLLSCLLFMSCSLLKPKIEQPSVKVTGLQLLPAKGFTQPIQVSLLIANPNARDLFLRGISYTVGIENFEVLSGVSNELPTLTAYKETAVDVVVTANVLQLLQLFEHFNRNGMKNSLQYNFSAKLDFNAFLPVLHVNEKGSLTLDANGKVKREKINQ